MWSTVCDVFDAHLQICAPAATQRLAQEVIFYKNTKVSAKLSWSRRRMMVRRMREEECWASGARWLELGITPQYLFVPICVSLTENKALWSKTKNKKTFLRGKVLVGHVFIQWKKDVLEKNMFIFLKVSHWKVWCSYLYQNQESYYIFYVNSTFSNDTQAHDTYRDTHNCWYQLETIKSYIQPLLFSPCPLKCLYFTSLYVQLKQLAYGFNLQSVSVCVVSILLSDAISLWET